MFRFAMGWSRSAHVSFRNGLESLRPCFVSQWAGVAPPMFRFAMGWNRSAHVSIFFIDRREPSTSPCHSRDATTPRDRRINLCLMTQHIASARQCEFLEFWGGLDSPTHFEWAVCVENVAWTSELFVFLCGLEFQAICISLWLGVPSSVVVFVFRCGLEFRAICLLMWLGVPCYLYFPQIAICIFHK